MDIKQIITNVKGWHKMFIAELQVDYIYHYLGGYLSCYKEFKIGQEDDINYIFMGRFAQWMHEWISKNLTSVEFSFLWYKMLKDVTESESEATNLFFRISDDFFNEFDNDKAKKY